MNQTTDATPISDFILQGERNLRIAEAIYSAEYVKARDTLVKHFYDRLKAELANKLTGWKFEPEGFFFTDKYGAFTFWKPNWKDQYYIRLEAYDSGKKMIYGIWRHELIHKRPLSTALLEAVQRRLPSARSRDWFEAEIKLQSPAPDWRLPEILWQIHTKDRFLKEVAEQLLELVKISEQIVDSLVAKYAGNK
jgi:hypothetical protein